MTATSRIQRTVTDYRQRLLANEATAAKALDAAHQHTLKEIQPALDKLYREIAQAQQDGEAVPLSWLYEQRRLENIKNLISGQVTHYSVLAQATTSQIVYQSAVLGQQAGQDLLDSTVPHGIDFSFGIPSPKAITDIVGATRPGSPLADLFRGFGEEAADKASKALITGVSLGWNPRRIAPQVEQALGISRARALTIARTEALRAYRSANLETFRANADVVAQWRWTCDLSRRTCAACLAMDGTLHDVSEDLESHVQCRCTPVPVTKSWDEILGPLGIDSSGIEETSIDIQSGTDWLDEQDESTQRAVLGNKYDGWSNGDFTLKDIVGHTSDPDWGHSIYEKSLKQLAKA